MCATSFYIQQITVVEGSAPVAVRIQFSLSVSFSVFRQHCHCHCHFLYLYRSLFSFRPLLLRAFAFTWPQHTHSHTRAHTNEHTNGNAGRSLMCALLSYMYFLHSCTHKQKVKLHRYLCESKLILECSPLFFSHYFNHVSFWQAVALLASVFGE